MGVELNGDGDRADRGPGSQLYIALSSVHALILCGLQFISCVRGQWTGEPQAPLGRGL